MALLLIVIAILSPRRRRIEVGIAIGVVAAAMLTRASTPDPTLLSIVGWGVGGAVAWGLFRLLIRDRPWIVAPALLCLVVLRTLAELAEPAFPGARFVDVAAIVGAIVGYRLWCWLVDADARSVAAAPRRGPARAVAR